jgi:hypothetical protein
MEFLNELTEDRIKLIELENHLLQEGWETAGETFSNMTRLTDE